MYVTNEEVKLAVIYWMAVFFIKSLINLLATVIRCNLHSIIVCLLRLILHIQPQTTCKRKKCRPLEPQSQPQKSRVLGYLFLECAVMFHLSCRTTEQKNSI